MDLLLVRHGESEGNAAMKMQGRGDYPLTEKGRDQARRLGTWLSERHIGWDVAYCSPLLRAVQTAEIVTETASGPKATTDDDLREFDVGVLEGMTREDMLEKQPSFLERAVTDLGDFSQWGGERYDDLQARIARVRARLEERHAEGRVLVVAHGGVNFQIIKSLICLPVPRVCIFRLGNCSATLIKMRDRRGVRIGEVVWHLPVELMGGESGEGTSALFR